MKRFTLIVCFSLLVLLIIAAPVTASITKISPAGGYTGKTATVTITGSNFTLADVDVIITNDDEEISGTVSSVNSTAVVCSFSIKSSSSTGKWDLTVINNDDWEQVESNGFTVRKPTTLNSIAPTSAQSGDDDVDFTLKGKYFEDDINDIYLLNSDDDEFGADDFEVKSSTEITGTFDLSDVDEDTYDVCIEDAFGAVECDNNAFKVTTNAEGSIEISSSPSGASIFIDNIANGTTPNTVDDILVGSYKIVLKKSGYEDWGKVVTVEEDETTEVDANLYAIRTATPTTAQTPAQTTVPRTTVRTTVKSTIKIPTTWVDTATTTAASPLDPAIIIGAIGLVFLALRKP